jgi:hypothetical protein
MNWCRTCRFGDLHSKRGGARHRAFEGFAPHPNDGEDLRFPKQIRIGGAPKPPQWFDGARDRTPHHAPSEIVHVRIRDEMVPEIHLRRSTFDMGGPRPRSDASLAHEAKRYVARDSLELTQIKRKPHTLALT